MSNSRIPEGIVIALILIAWGLIAALNARADDFHRLHGMSAGVPRGQIVIVSPGHDANLWHGISAGLPRANVRIDWATPTTPRITTRTTRSLCCLLHNLSTRSTPSR